MAKQRLGKRVYTTRVKKKERPTKTLADGVRTRRIKKNGIGWKEIRKTAKDRKLWMERCKRDKTCLTPVCLTPNDRKSNKKKNARIHWAPTKL